jgi:SAM-dependent methyltransferase
MRLEPLRGAYYAECNAVFRRTTNQSDLMLDSLERLVGNRGRLRLMSAGAGVGLFEIPMLHMLGERMRRFVGIDFDRHACEVLERKLAEAFPAGLEWQVHHRSFQEFEAEQQFDLILFNHVFEYLDGDLAGWLNKAIGLLAENGQLVIFSPNRGGINKVYAEVADPHFTEDLMPLLAGFRHSTHIIEANCDTDLLDGSLDQGDGICLLSFLTQADCRNLSVGDRKQLAKYFKSLRSPGQSSIPHPTTLIIVDE